MESVVWRRFLVRMFVIFCAVPASPAAAQIVAFGASNAKGFC